MSNHRTITRTAPIAILAAATLGATAADLVMNAGNATPARAQAMAQFKAVNSNANFYTHDNGRIGRVYGRAFSHGDTAAQSVESFISQHSNMWGVNHAELVAEGPFDDGRHTQPVFYQPEYDDYKFTATYYAQTRAGLPVYNATLMLLTRNEQNNPLVLASSTLKDLSAFNPDPVVARAAVNRDAITQLAAKQFNGEALIWSTDRVIYAGDEANPHAPVVADNTIIEVDGYKKFRLITDAATGAVVYEESLICHVDVSGNVSGLATEGLAADFCEDEISMPLPYLNVSLQGGGASITDVNGDFTIPNGGSADVTLNAELDGQWFDVFNFLGSETSESLTGSPGTAFDVLFNSLNNSEQVRAQVNAYVESNRIRDLVLQANPAYPLVAGTSMDVFVNRTDGFCPGNAWYDPTLDTINFCLANGSSPNTAWSSVVHHEYGHHLVSAGGSLQGQYGEGFGDVMSVIILDHPDLAIGFFGSCGSPLRTALNNLTFPCATDGHACAPLLSGAVWQTREQLVVTEPDDYQDILMDLAVNSVFLHTYNLITPQITIDWLTLDDDDADIGNGTPHYFEIDAGFSVHNLDAPPLLLVDINPVGLPDFASPNGGTTVSAEFTNVTGTLDPSTPTLMVDTGSGFQPIPMTNTSGDTYAADLPGDDCGDSIQFYFTADTLSGFTQNEPAGAPSSAYSILAAQNGTVLGIVDNFEVDQGWTVTSDAGGASNGEWERGVPAGDGSRADAPDDFDGSGSCYVTGNGGPGSNTDVDGGSTVLTSPIMQAADSSTLSYARWFNNAGNSAVDDIFVVEVSDNAGSSWTNLETLGVNHPQSNGGWFEVEFEFSAIPGIVANDQFRIRFIATDTGDGSIVEAGIDAVELLSLDCSSCPADLTGDGMLNFFDVSAFLSAYSAMDPAADFDGNGSFDFFDVSAFLNAFSAGCP